ncbi:MAG: hypothetical protein WCC08_11200 [Terrimicrobiaceae bacterium]
MLTLGGIDKDKWEPLTLKESQGFLSLRLRKPIPIAQLNRKALIVPAGVDAGLISVALRGRGIFVEGPITVPAAAAAASE